MMPLGGGSDVAPSLGVLLCATEQDEAVTALGALGFTGWVSPRRARWTVAVPEHPVGHVAAKRRDLLAVGAAAAAASGAATVAIAIRREELMYLVAHDGEARLVDYVSDAQLARPGDEYAFGPRGPTAARRSRGSPDTRRREPRPSRSWARSTPRARASPSGW